MDPSARGHTGRVVLFLDMYDAVYVGRHTRGAWRLSRPAATAASWGRGWGGGGCLDRGRGRCRLDGVVVDIATGAVLDRSHEVDVVEVTGADRWTQEQLVNHVVSPAVAHRRHHLAQPVLSYLPCTITSNVTSSPSSSLYTLDVLLIYNNLSTP